MNPHKILRAGAIAAVTLVATLTAACGGTGSSGSGDAGTLTVYSADGLATWYKSTFDRFTRDTGIAVNLVEAGSGEVVSRVEKEQSNPQADLLVTLPPFIQKADESGLLASFPENERVDTAGIAEGQVGPDGRYVPIVNNALSFIANPGAQPTPAGWDDLLDPRFKGKLQYSTPGQAGDGTAVLVLLQHLRGKAGALDYLTKLQANNVGPSSSTGKLQPKVSNGELLVANGDVQMNLGSIKDDASQFTIFIPEHEGKRVTVSLPYVAGVTKGAPNADNAKKLLAFLLSADVQRTVATEALGLPVREGLVNIGEPQSNTPAGVLEGVELWVPDWNAVLADLDADVAAYQKATGN
ncbi:MAG TPA: 2-aminoethylphosphonate ABC transporter substrate-binding protein [Mycobacterium sp.]|nr:2-aminoethylphosphonate ABC transporter substrate-binding protein [Mycobacterium sp.]